jgi:hypothetical protein
MAVATALAGMATTPAHAFSIDTGNPDLEMRWDNQVRYNVGLRMEKPNSDFANVSGHDESETRFDRGDVITNRLNLLTELDLIYQGNYGMRLSGAAWHEMAYSDRAHTNPALNAAFPVPPTSNGGPGGKYSNYAERYLTGSSGELLDAFVFGQFQLGSTTLSAKLGKHNVYWGEALFTIADSVSAGQGPLDLVKAATSTGAVEAKELYMPINQLSAQWTLSNELAVLAQYQFDWKPFRLVPGGTYFAGSDGSGDPRGNDPLCASTRVGGGCIRSLKSIMPGDDGGDYGLALRWSPEWMVGTTLGLYYRKYDEKLPWSVTQLQGRNPSNAANLGVRLSYARDTELWGISMNRDFGGVSVGAELSYRQDTALNSVSGFFVGSAGDTPASLGYFASPAANIALTHAPSYSQVEGARGNTWHGVLNGVWLLPQTSLWNSGTLQGELAYQRLDKVTKNANIFYSESHACRFGYLPGGIVAGKRNKKDGCATDDSLALNLSFAPEWAQVLPGLNLKMPVSLSYGAMGNSPTLGGSAEGAYKWSIGLTGTYRTVYELGMAYTDSYADYSTQPGTAGNGGVPGTSVLNTKNGSAEANNRAWLSIYFKTSF